LKADVHNFFRSIDHGRLKQTLRQSIKDEDVLWLLDLIIDNGGENGRGVPIGNLTSQLFANVYLDRLDWFIKDTLRARHYIRYMDDFVILSHDHEELRFMLAEIEAFMNDVLALSMNPKTTIVNTKNGVDFCGYRHFADHKKVRRRAVKNMDKTIKAYRKGRITKARMVKSVASWLGHIGHADTYNLRAKMMAKLPPEIQAEFITEDEQ
jgi:hypothetical protein